MTEGHRLKPGGERSASALRIGPPIAWLVTGRPSEGSWLSRRQTSLELSHRVAVFADCAPLVARLCRLCIGLSHRSPTGATNKIGMIRPGAPRSGSRRRIRSRRVGGGLRPRPRGRRCWSHRRRPGKDSCHGPLRKFARSSRTWYSACSSSSRRAENRRRRQSQGQRRADLGFAQLDAVRKSSRAS